ncbi:MAG: hypothetical protein ACRD0M_07475, partial [Acidimicrobiales bacterium]
GATRVVFIDLDRLLHWQEAWPAELAGVLNDHRGADLTVLGRTARAFATHPGIQRDTEAVVNTVFARLTGRQWDVLTGARGFSRRGAEAIVTGCPRERTVGTDAAWPLFLLRRRPDLRVDYREVEGLEFETADRYADQVGAAGSVAAWTDGLDDDPQAWADRLDLARHEVEAMLRVLDNRRT